MSSKGTFPLNLKLCFSILIGRNQEPVVKLNLISEEFLHLGLHSCKLEKLKIYTEFELWALNGERVSKSLSLSKGPAVGVFT